MQWALLISLLKAGIAFSLTEVDPVAYPGVVKVLTMLQSALNLVTLPTATTAQAIPDHHMAKVGTDLPVQPFTEASVRDWARKK